MCRCQSRCCTCNHPGPIPPPGPNLFFFLPCSPFLGRLWVPPRAQLLPRGAACAKSTRVSLLLPLLALEMETTREARPDYARNARAPKPKRRGWSIAARIGCRPLGITTACPNLLIRDKHFGFSSASEFLPGSQAKPFFPFISQLSQLQSQSASAVLADSQVIKYLPSPLSMYIRSEHGSAQP
jgi:hypothetical protein